MNCCEFFFLSVFVSQLSRERVNPEGCAKLGRVGRGNLFVKLTLLWQQWWVELS